MRRRIPTVIVFAKAPRLGRGKRRLAADVGDLGAWRFQRGNLASLLRTLGADRRWRVTLAVTPDRMRWRDSGIRWAMRRRHSVMGQGGGDLGRRMRRALERELAASRRPAVLIGSDVPGITRALIHGAFTALGRDDVVFGPAVDGGFWLVGAGWRRRLPRGLFDGCRWSTAQALSDAAATIPKPYRVGRCAVLADVDDGNDLRRHARGRFTGK